MVEEVFAEWNHLRKDQNCIHILWDIAEEGRIHIQDRVPESTFLKTWLNLL